MEVHQLGLEETNNAGHGGGIDAEELLPVGDQNTSIVLGLPAGKEVHAIGSLAGISVAILNGLGQEFSHATTEHDVEVLAGHLGNQLGGHVNTGAGIHSVVSNIRIALPHSVGSLGISSRWTGVGQGGGGDNGRGLAGILGPLGDGGQAVGRLLAGSAVVEVHGGTHSNVDNVGFYAAQVGGGRAGGVWNLGIGTVGLDSNHTFRTLKSL